MSNIFKYLRYYFSFFTDHPVCCINTLLVALTVGGEQLFETISFNCPKNYFLVKTYVLFSLICPVLALLILGILGRNLTHRLCQGVKDRKESNECSSFCSGLYYVAAIVGRSLIIPSAWIFVCLMDGDLYACYHWTPNCTETEVNANVPCTLDSDADEKVNKLLSHQWAWGFLIAILTVTGIFILISRCCDSRTHVHSLYADITLAAEKEQMRKHMKERAEELAISNVTTLMLDENLKKEDWDKIALEAPKSDIEKCHSPLQKWIFDRKKPPPSHPNTDEGEKNDDTNKISSVSP